MTLLSLLITLVVIGVVMFLINQIPMDARIKNIIYVLAILFIVVWLLQSLGVLGNFGNVRIR